MTLCWEFGLWNLRYQVKAFTTAYFYKFGYLLKKKSGKDIYMGTSFQASSISFPESSLILYKTNWNTCNIKVLAFRFSNIFNFAPWCIYFDLCFWFVEVNIALWRKVWQFVMWYRPVNICVFCFKISEWRPKLNFWNSSLRKGFIFSISWLWNMIFLYDNTDNNRCTCTVLINKSLKYFLKWNTRPG